MLNKTAAMMIKLVSLMKQSKLNPPQRDFANQQFFPSIYTHPNIINNDPYRPFQFYPSY
jgi:hypothetical protein